MPAIEDYEIELINRFYKDSSKYYKNVSKLFVEYRNDVNYIEKLRILSKQHIYLRKLGRLRKNTKKEKVDKLRASIVDLFEQEEIKTNYTLEERDYIFRYCIEKIRGLYKHASWKTGIC